MKNLKKLLAVVLSFAMVIGTLTVTTFGAATQYNSSNFKDQKMSGFHDYYLGGNIYSGSSQALQIDSGADISLDVRTKQIYSKNNGYNAVRVLGGGSLILTSTAERGVYTTSTNSTYYTTPCVNVLANGKLLLTPGTSISRGASAIDTNGRQTLSVAGTADINGAIIRGNMTVTGTVAKNLTSGYFYNDVSAYCAEGYECVPDTTMTGCQYKVQSKTNPDSYAVHFYNRASEVENLRVVNVPAGEGAVIPNGMVGGQIATWFTTPDLSGTEYKAGQTIPANADGTDVALFAKLAEPLVKVTVGSTTLGYDTAESAKTAVQEATGTIIVEVTGDIGDEDPATWRDDFEAKVTHTKATVYSTEILKAVAYAKNLTTDGSTADFVVLNDCEANGGFDFYGVYSEDIYRTINVDLNGKEITFSASSGNVFGMSRRGYVNITDSVGGAVLNTNGRYLLYTPGYNSTATFSGGTYLGLSSMKGSYVNQSQLKVNGGAFSVDPTTWVMAGYHAVVDNPDTPTLWTVEKIPNLAEVTINEVTTQYETIDEAIAAANTAGNTATIKILGNGVWDTEYTIIADKITIDLNGKTVSQSSGKTNSFATVAAGSELEIIDNVGGGKMTPATVVKTEGTFDVEGTYSDVNGVVGGGVRTIGEGTVTGKHVAQVTHDTDVYKTVSVYDAAKVAAVTTADASTADVVLLDDAISTGDIPFYTSWDNNVNRTINVDLNGKSITATGKISEFFGMSKLGTLNFNDSVGGAVIDAKDSPLIYAPGYQSHVYFNGGDYRNLSAFGAGYINGYQIHMTGGTYNLDPSLFVVKGYHAEENEGIYSIVENPGIVEVTVGEDTTTYKAFEDAWAAANVADQEATIRLVDDAVWPDALTTVADKLTIDLNGFTLADATGSEKRLLVVSKNTEVDIVDNSASGKGELVAKSTTAGKNGAIIVYGTFKALGGTIKTTATNSDAWYQEEVISAYSNNPTIIIDGATISSGCLAKPAIGVHSGTVEFISGAIDGGVLNYGDSQTLIGIGVAKTFRNGSSDITYYTTFDAAKKAVIYSTQAAPYEINITLLEDISISSRIDFMTIWNESASRTVNFDFNGHNITATKKLDSIIGINSAGYARIYDNAGGAVIDACGSTLFYSCGYLNDFMIYGGTFINAGGENPMGNNRTGVWSIKLFGGTYNFDVTDHVGDSDHFAYDNGDGTWNVRPKDFTATVDGVNANYSFLSEAVAAVSASDTKVATIKANSDVKFDEALIVNDSDMNITLDLNGHTAKPASGEAFAKLINGGLTITNGKIDFTGCDELARITVDEGLSLNFSGVTFAGANVFVESKGTVVIDGILTYSGVVLQEKTAVSINEVSAEIADDVKFTFIVNAALVGANEGSNVELQYTVDTMLDNAADRKTITIEPDDSDGGQYKFVFEKGIPQWSVDSDLEIKILVDGEEALAVPYTLQDYYNTLNAYYPDNTPLNTLMANQIKFAEELQEKAFGKSAIEYKGWEDEFISVAEPKEYDNVKASVIKTGFIKGSQQIASALVNVTDRVALAYKIYYPKYGANLVVTDEDGNVVETEYGENMPEATAAKPWYVYQEKLSPLDFGKTFTATLSYGGAPVHSITYSVNSYCYQMANKTDEAAKQTALALYRYGVAAAAYTTENDPAKEHNFGEINYKWSAHYLECTATRACTDAGCTEVQTETATAYKTVTKEAVGDLAEEYTMTAKFENPVFRTQVHVAYPDAKALTPEEEQNVQDTAYEKHLITNADGSYGGTSNEALYGEGTPLNGALDQVEDGKYVSKYYAVNDYYNLKSSANRVILPKFQSYQQTMQYSDGLACVLMALNYMGEDVAETYNEENLVKLYEQVNETTVMGNGTTQDGLEAMLLAEGFNANANDYKESGLDFNSWVKTSIEAGKIIMGYFHMDRQERWMTIIGYDDMGTSATGDDIFIFANPYDVWDHYQDGYYNGVAPWMYAVDLAGEMTRINESVAITPSEPITLEYDYVNDPVKCYPSMGERHLLYNLDGNWGGALNAAVYGGGGTQNGQVQYDDGYRSREHFEYNYYAFPDIYNMTNNGNGLHVLPHWESFEQTMASSCGISSTLNTLNYLGFDLTTLSQTVKRIMDENNIKSPDDLKVASNFDILQNLAAGIEEGDHSKMQEAIVAIYTLNDTYFSSEGHYLDTRGLSGFNNYGGVGAGNLHNVPLELGFKNTTFGRYYSSTYKSKGASCMPFPTYDSFLSFVTTNIDNGQPIIFCGPNHWRVIMGIDTMGTTDTRDDIVFLGDSSDGWDHFQNGIDTEPARTFYAKWYNGGKNTNQQYILIKK